MSERIGIIVFSVARRGDGTMCPLMACSALSDVVLHVTSPSGWQIATNDWRQSGRSFAAVLFAYNGRQGSSHADVMVVLAQNMAQKPSGLVCSVARAL
eukprot:694021-Amphidinium_carterae.2